MERNDDFSHSACWYLLSRRHDNQMFKFVSWISRVASWTNVQIGFVDKISATSKTWTVTAC